MQTTPTDHGPETALTLEPCGDGGSTAGASAAPDRRSGRAGRAHAGATGAEPEPPSCAGEKRARSAEVGGACRPPCSGVAARMIVRSICRARLAWISWPGDRTEQRLGDRPGSHRPQTAHAAERLGEQRVVGEPAEELRVVVIEAEREANVVDARIALRATTIVPSGRCIACTRSRRSSTRTVAR